MSETAITDQDYERWFKRLDGQIRLLEREREKLSAIVNHTDAAFFVVDDEGQVEWVNSVYRERFARDEDEPVGGTCNRLLCGRNDRCEGCPVARTSSSGEVSHLETKRWIDGRYHDAYVTAMPVRSPEGAVEQVIVMMQDISNLDAIGRSEQALMASEQRFRSIFQMVGAGMATARADGTLLQVNQALCAMLGHTERDLLRLKLSDICHPEDLDEIAGQLDEVRSGGRGAIELEQRFRRSDGAQVWGHSTTVWQFDEEGAPSYGILLVQDITARKLAQSSLLEQQDRYETLMNSLEGVVWEADPEHFAFSFVSPQAARILGHAPDRWLSKPRFWRNHIHAADLEGVLADCRRAAETQSGCALEYRLMDGDGDVRWIRDQISVVVEDGKTTKLRGVMVDVTQRKNAEAALQASEEQLRQSHKMEAIGRLAGGIAHDFNNLLTAISGYAELVTRGLGTQHPLHREAAEIGKAAHHAAGLTAQLLAFSRRQVLNPKQLDLNDVVEEMGTMLRRTIGADIELSIALGDGVGMVEADPTQLQQVILNLAVNARDAMPDGGRLTIETTVDALDGTRFVRVSVSDTGCGLDEETRSRLFEPFFTTKKAEERTGLGLSTVYGIVNQSGGSVDVRSEVGVGTTFDVYLPRIGEALPPEEPEPQLLGEAIGGIETILLVEDDDTVRELTREILELNGYTVVEACDGTEALGICTEDTERFDLLISDLVMPQMGGVELGQAVKELRPDLRVLFLSGYSDTVSAGQGSLDPGAYFLQKPFTPTVLARKVREVLEAAES